MKFARVCACVYVCRCVTPDGVMVAQSGVALSPGQRLLHSYSYEIVPVLYSF